MKQLKQLKEAFDKGNTPKQVLFCFQGQCPKSSECVHYLCYLARGEAEEWGKAVFPKVLTEQACPFWAPLRVVRMAWGFDNLFRDVRVKDAPKLRAAMIALFGSKGQYYRFKLGQRKLVPEQQADVKKLFADYGYGDVAFDHYAEELDVTHC